MPWIADAVWWCFPKTLSHRCFNLFSKSFAHRVAYLLSSPIRKAAFSSSAKQVHLNMKGPSYMYWWKKITFKAKLRHAYKKDPSPKPQLLSWLKIIHARRFWPPLHCEAKIRIHSLATEYLKNVLGLPEGRHLRWHQGSQFCSGHIPLGPLLARTLPHKNKHYEEGLLWVLQKIFLLLHHKQPVLLWMNTQNVGKGKGQKDTLVNFDINRAHYF